MGTVKELEQLVDDLRLLDKELQVSWCKGALQRLPEVEREYKTAEVSGVTMMVPFWYDQPAVEGSKHCLVGAMRKVTGSPMTASTVLERDSERFRTLHNAMQTRLNEQQRQTRNYEAWGDELWLWNDMQTSVDPVRDLVVETLEVAERVLYGGE